MKKALYSILVGALTALMLVAAPHGASAAVHTEGFESAVPAGWTVRNNSAPVGTTSVFQGYTAAFSSHQGAATSYAAMNYDATGSATVGTISLWLISPQYNTLSNGDAWSFFTRTVESFYPDRLEVRMSTNGSCDPGAGVSSTGDFTTLLQTINPQVSVNGYPSVWSEMSGALSGIRGAKSGCFAFRYDVPDAGYRGVNSNFIGIDTYSYDDQPTDVTAPDTSIISGPDGDTNDATPTFGFESSEAGSTFECSLDSAEFNDCSGPDNAHTTDALADGRHSISVRAVDAAGNADDDPAIRSFVIDATAPDTTIVSVTGGGITNDTTPTFAFESSEAGSTFECSLDTAHFGPCSGPDATHTTDALAEGSYTFAVRATDALGNTDPTPAQHALSIDTTAPENSIISGPDGDTSDTTPSFEFESSEPGSSYECSLDEAAFSACSGPGSTHTTDALDDGDHSIAVRATDAAGNVATTPATRSFTVDTTAPETEIVSGPDGDTSNTTPTFGFESSDDDATFECSVDDTEFSPCSGPDGTHTTDALDDGNHTIAVRSTDVLGNVGSPATQRFTVDTVAPDTSIVFGPEGETDDTTPTFGFESSEDNSTFECSLDQAAFSACAGAGGTHTTAVLSPGAHTIAVRASDALDQTDATPATRAFAVVLAPVVSPAPKDCSVDQAAVTTAKTALTKANKAVTSANKKVKSAKKALKSAKKHGNKKAVKKAKTELSKANKTAKKAKQSASKLKKGLTAASGKLAACQRA